MRVRSFFVATAVITAACGGDSPDKAPPAAAGPAATVSPDDYRKAQQAYADSLLNATGSAADIVKKMGAEYAVGSTRLRDSLATLSTKTGCFMKGRESDPYLAGTVSYFVFMSVVGSNVVRVQESQWTSAAGNIVDSCLNLAAKDWKFDVSFGKQGSYITQVQFK
jgi:hypothetical protein